MNFGNLLKEKRKSLGLTLEEVGDAAGISKSHLYGLENGAHPNPGLYTCARLSLALGLSVSAMAAAIIESHTTAAAPAAGGEHG